MYPANHSYMNMNPASPMDMNMNHMDINHMYMNPPNNIDMNPMNMNQYNPMDMNQPNYMNMSPANPMDMNHMYMNQYNQMDMNPPNYMDMSPASPMDMNQYSPMDMNQPNNMNHPSPMDMNQPKPIKETRDKGQDYFQEMVNDLEKQKRELDAKIRDKNRELIILHNQHKNDHIRFKESVDIEYQKNASLDKQNFIKSQENQDLKLRKLQQQMTNVKMMEQDYYQNASNIRSLRSVSNPSRLVSITPLNQNEFLLNLNNKCLTVENQNKYHLEPCSSNKPGQRFIKDSVYDNATFLSVFPDTEEVPSQIDPFNLVYSKMTGSCLTEEGEGISLQECQKLFSDINNKQKWKPESLPPRC